MYVDNNLEFIDEVGLADGTTLWATLWAHTTSNISDVIDMQNVTNRKIAKGGYVVWQCGTQPAQAAGGTTRLSLICSAAVGLGTNTVLWTSGEIDDAVVSAWVANTIIFVHPFPAIVPLRYVGCEFYFTTTAWTAGTMHVYITPDYPLPYSGYVM